MPSGLGVLGELEAARYLRKKGYRIETSNFRCREGEIDLIASKGKILAFVEVKARGERMLLQPREAVDRKKQQRIIKTAMRYLQITQCGLQPRFDILEAFFTNGSDPKLVSIHYIENAFDAEGFYATV